MTNPGTARTTVRMPKGIKAWVERYSDAKGISENALILIAIEEKRAAEGKIGVQTSAAEIQTV